MEMAENSCKRLEMMKICLFRPKSDLILHVLTKKRPKITFFDPQMRSNSRALPKNTSFQENYLVVTITICPSPTVVFIYHRVIKILDQQSNQRYEHPPGMRISHNRDISSR